VSVGRKRLRQYPQWFVDVIGGDIARLLTRSQRVTNAALRRATPWRPRYASPLQGLPQVLREIDAARAALSFAN
jgi:hypothetical protein